VVTPERSKGAAGLGAAVHEKFKAIQDDVISGDAAVLEAHCSELLAQGEKASAILNHGLIPAMERIGDRFRTGGVFIPEVLLAARAMNEVLDVLEPHLVDDDKDKGQKVLIGTVQGDMHDIGKNMVAIMLRGVGFEVLDLGVNVPRDVFVARAEEFQPDVVGISALLTTTMPEMKGIIDALRSEERLPGIKVVVGGAPVNRQFAENIGADGYGQDAGDAVHVVKRLFEGQ
jgi:5-methyltetrahydrofolate--homocysteine methyltransferase